MNKAAALNFSDDIRKELLPGDFSETIYLSIKNIGTRVFKNCRYEQTEGWLFVWTEDDTYTVKASELGDFILIDVYAETSDLLR